MDNHGKSSHFWRGKGFYIVLAVVTAGAALTSYFAMNAMMDRIGISQSQSQSTLPNKEDITWGLDSADVNNSQSQVPKPQAPSSASSSTAPSPTASSVAQQTLPASDAPPVVQTPSYVLPVNGDILQAFSGDSLVYNETMQDWRTHNGVDIRATVNMGVHAPADAVVTKVYDDAHWGGVIELTAGELVMRMCGVAGAHVKEGDTVKQGDAIGKVGTIACESALEEHVHVEFIEHDAYVDPLSYCKG